jgi:hypothetical protein
MQHQSQRSTLARAPPALNGFPDPTGESKMTSSRQFFLASHLPHNKKEFLPHD